MCFGNISKDYAADNMEQTRLNRCLQDFLVDYGSDDGDDILDNHEYLMKKNNIK